MDLQIGTETELTVGIPVKGVEISASKTIPVPFQRGWGDSRKFQEMERFLTEEKGMISTSMGICYMYEVLLDSYKLLPFTDPFKIALRALFSARKLSASSQRTAFKRFVGQYGTHFLVRTKMGAEFTYQTKYHEAARKQFDANTLKECNYVKGAKLFGIQLEQDKSGCTSTQESRLNQLGSSNVEVEVITKGSRPTDIKDWATQNFTPVPLKFQLSSIINLMKEQYIDDQNLEDNGEKVNSFEIRKWFLPLYYDYCTVMNVDCSQRTGCGYNDKCPFDTICQKGGSVHQCSGIMLIHLLTFSIITNC